jgi:hypothetical protein
MVADDFDGDGNLDILINTNDFGTEVSTGRYDALSGLVLKGDGNGNFAALTPSESGIFIPGNGKALVRLRGAANKYLVAAGQNRGPLKIFELKSEAQHIPLLQAETSAVLTLSDGRTRKVEYYYGSSFLSGSARFITADQNVKKIIISDNRGTKRTIDLH